MNNILEWSEKNCTSCQMCSAVCPREAIEIQLNDEGFYQPLVNDKKCVNCGICKKTCYKYDSELMISNDLDAIDVYAAQSKDKHILGASTSGGIANHIALACLSRGYKVVGVLYDLNLDIARTYIASSPKEVENFRGSKYMQSYTEIAFNDIVNDKTEQKYVLFGTPCHIYALRKYIDIKDQRDRFLLVDIFCHGCPSVNLWKKYIEHVKRSMKVKKFQKVDFRSKERGWHEYCHVFYDDNVRFRSKRVNDPFFSLFFDDIALNRACYDCKIRGTLEYTDIRLGDFWGDQYALNKEGVSAIIVCNDRGRKLFDGLRDDLYIKEHVFSDVEKYQSYNLEYNYNEKSRSDFLAMLSTNNDIHKIFKHYRKTYPKRKKIKFHLKKVISILPKSTLDKIKRRILLIRKHNA